MLAFSITSGQLSSFSSFPAIKLIYFFKKKNSPQESSWNVSKSLNCWASVGREAAVSPVSYHPVERENGETDAFHLSAASGP